MDTNASVCKSIRCFATSVNRPVISFLIVLAWHEYYFLWQFVRHESCLHDFAQSIDESYRGLDISVQVTKGVIVRY